MRQPTLLHDLIAETATRQPARASLSDAAGTIDYESLASRVAACASGLVQLGLGRGERVGLWLEKRVEFVVGCFGTAAAGGVFVPMNPLLKAPQVAYILQDCAARILITSAQRLAALGPQLELLGHLRAIVVVDELPPDASRSGPPILHWSALVAAAGRAGHRVVDADMAAILYTSGSTGMPKGVVLSHRNMVVGAGSVAAYLDNRPDDVLLAALPLSFDAGFSQLTTGFLVGARVVLLNYLLPRDVLQAIGREGVTGLTAVPPLYIQLTSLAWPEGTGRTLRYFANTGGRMPAEILSTLRQRLPQARPFLMYGLTEAFRSTYLAPEEVDRRPDSIGKAIPNAEILVLREDGSECAPDEPGELVHRGALVALGYWNDAAKTAERFRPLPPGAGGRPGGLQIPELAVFSGDTVRCDAEGFLYFVGRRDEMIKTSGYRVSPTEVEEAVYVSRRVGECAVYGIDDAMLGQAIHAVVTPPADGGAVDVDALLADCRRSLPAYMVPAAIEVLPGPLPRNPNGKIDRRQLAQRRAARRPEATDA